jgi:hypothetical protein
MLPKRARQTLRDRWKPQDERKRMRWYFYVVVSDLKCFNQLVEELAPFGYRTVGYDRRSRRKVPRTEHLVLIEQLTQEQVYAEIMRVHKACDRLGDLMLDIAEAANLVSPNLLRN